ncbi:MAG TPA: hypothetical protein VND64_18830 [Pirellulales bacterium]|nr:hypothetical protein [Pirellulales bacterium]
MWRALFLALGVYCCLLGAECLVIDKAVLSGARGGGLMGALNPVAAKRELVPSDWAPWSLLSAGVVTILYSFSVPKRLVKT